MFTKIWAAFLDLFDADKCMTKLKESQKEWGGKKYSEQPVACILDYKYTIMLYL